MQQKGQGIHPKIPHRPQGGGEGAEKQRRASQKPQQDEHPQFPLGPAEGEEKQGRAYRQTVEDVQRGGETGQAQPEGPQQIVQHPRRQAQQNGLAKDQKLLGDVIFHRAYPNSRRKKPPRSGPPSS